MERSRFLISESVNRTWELVQAGKKEDAFNFASLVLWRVEHHQSWLTDKELHFISLCLAFRPRRRRTT
jgi:hypothetical protein